MGALLYDIYIFFLCHLSQFPVWRLTWNSSLEYKLAITTLIAIGISSISIIHQGQCLVFTATIPPRLILRTKITRICIFRCVWPISPISPTIICIMPNKPYDKMSTCWNYTKLNMKLAWKKGRKEKEDRRMDPPWRDDWYEENDSYNRRDQRNDQEDCPRQLVSPGRHHPFRRQQNTTRFLQIRRFAESPAPKWSLYLCHQRTRNNHFGAAEQTMEK